jgi:hypothetical protein
LSRGAAERARAHREDADRPVTVRAETALAGCNTPDSCGFMMFSVSPN